ncbi:hypothetical protein TWF730_006429 [Orbilia blumenaviensis]|uniref:Uncharacterized protein n=1 Tax=Orbilia blumenaviensis TaxID=1796055 RepID=A0AAV9VGL7_9PEZI
MMKSGLSSQSFLVTQVLCLLWTKLAYSQSTITTYLTTRVTSTITGSCNGNPLPLCENVGWLPQSNYNSTANASRISTSSTGTSSTGTTSRRATTTRLTTSTTTSTSGPAPSLFFLEGSGNFSGYFAVLGGARDVFLTNIEIAAGIGFSLDEFGQLLTLEEPIKNLLYRKNSTLAQSRKRQDDLLDWGNILAALPEVAAALGVTERFYFEGKELRLENGGNNYTLYVQQQNGTHFLMKMARLGSSVPQEFTRLPLTWASTSGTVTAARPTSTGTTTTTQASNNIGSSTGTGTNNPSATGTTSTVSSSILAYDIITSLKLQSFCSLFLGYLGTVISTVEDISSIATSTSTSVFIGESTDITTDITTEISTSKGRSLDVQTATAIKPPRRMIKRKKQEIEKSPASLVWEYVSYKDVSSPITERQTSTAIETPDALKSFPTAELRAGCSSAVTAPQTSTEISTSVTSVLYVETAGASTFTSILTTTVSSTSITNSAELIISTIHANGIFRAEVAGIATNTQFFIFATQDPNGDTTIPNTGLEINTRTTQQAWGVSFVGGTRNALIVTQQLRSGNLMNTFGWQVSTSVIGNAELSSVISAYQVKMVLMGSSAYSKRGEDAAEDLPVSALDAAPRPRRGTPAEIPVQTAVELLYLDYADGYLLPAKEILQGEGYEGRDTFWICTDSDVPTHTTLYLYQSAGFKELAASWEPSLQGCTTFTSVLPMVVPTD